MAIEARMTADLRAHRLILWGVHVCLAVFWVRYAWLAEDAFINFRVLKHALAGDGLVWNLGERVQVFTSPLWILLSWALGSVTQELLWSTLALSFSLCAGTCWLLYRYCGKRVHVYLPIVVFAFASRSLRDFSSSGLEAPLLVFALVCFYGQAFGEASFCGLRRVVLSCAFCLLVRHDSLLLTFPFALAYAWNAWKAEGKSAGDFFRAMMPGLLLILVWTLFSVVYFGSPLPNTAAAKVVSGLARRDNFVNYFSFNLGFDPIGFSWIFIALLGACFLSRLALALVAALSLYIAYMYWVSCDYMAGRFLVGPIVLAIMVVVRTVDAGLGAQICAPFWGRLGVGLSVFAAVAFAVLPNESISNVDRRKIVNGMADERGYYFESTDLETLFFHGVEHPFKRSADHLNKMGPPPLIVGCNIGMVGYFVRDPVRMVDPLALGDKFLSLLPVKAGKVRVGHLERLVPRQYISSLIYKRNDFSDPRLRRAFDDVQLVVAGDIWSRARVAAIWRLLIGQHRAALQSFSEMPNEAVARIRPQDEVVGAGETACLGSGGEIMIPVFEGGDWSLHRLK